MPNKHSAMTETLHCVLRSIVVSSVCVVVLLVEPVVVFALSEWFIDRSPRGWFREIDKSITGATMAGEKKGKDVEIKGIPGLNPISRPAGGGLYANSFSRITSKKGLCLKTSGDAQQRQAQLNGAL